MTLLLGAICALAQDSAVFVATPVAGHPVFDLRVGVDQTSASPVGPDRPVLCGELYPLAWLSIEGCGTGSGLLHDANALEMAHFRTRARLASAQSARVQGDLLLGAGFAEIQSTFDHPGFKFGRAREPNPIEAAGPEGSFSVKGRYFLGERGRSHLTADLNVGTAIVPAAPDVAGIGPVVPFAAFTMGFGF